MTFYLCSIFLIFLFTVGTSNGAPKLKIKTNFGVCEGVLKDEKMRVWYGVPYAEPPLRERRFGRPVPITRFPTSPYLANKEPNSCYQNINTLFGNFQGIDILNPKNKLSEDCLYLNIYAPKRGECLPVVIWFFGGGYQTGSMSLDIYNPMELVNRGKMIFVSVQFRVGSLGYLYLGPNSPVKGNMGLYDQALALKWVYDNIESFGGDKDSITIMGSSSGAHAITLLASSKLTQHMIKRVILQSSGKYPGWWERDAKKIKQYSVTLAKIAGCANETMAQIADCLRRKDPKHIIPYDYGVKAYSVFFFPYLPVYDGELVDEDPSHFSLAEKLKALDIGKDILIGSNYNEGYWALMYAFPQQYPLQELPLKQRTLSKEAFHTIVNSVFSKYSEPVRRAIRYNYVRGAQRNSTEYLFQVVDKIIGDYFISCDVENFAEHNRHKPVYRYLFDYRSSSNIWPTYTGVKHGDEIEYTFGIPLRFPDRYTYQEINFSKRIMDYWSSFIASGSPNDDYHHYQPTWIPYEAQSGWKAMDLTLPKSKLVSLELRQRCNFWNTFLPRLISMTAKNPLQNPTDNEMYLDI